MGDRKDCIETIFGIIAVVAAICEMLISGVNAASVAGCIKDVFGTLAIIVLFFAIIKDRIPAGNFREDFEKSMGAVEKHYDPLISKYVPSENEKESFVEKNKKVVRYDILDSVENLFSQVGIGHSRVFEMEAEAPSKITFFVRAKFFGTNVDLEAIAKSIDLYLSKYLSKNYPEYKSSHGKDASGYLIEVDFNKELVSSKDAKDVINLIDTVIMLYIAKNKK